VAKDQNPAETRLRLIQAAFREFYQNGFQGTGLGAIIKRAGVSKGALYNHFESKQELGYAVVDEIITSGVDRFWLKPYREIDNPIDATLLLFGGLADNPPLDLFVYGCPANNLIQEMAPLDPSFRMRLVKLIDFWVAGMAESFRDGQNRGLVRLDVEAEDIALFILATFEGGIGLAKNSQDPSLFMRTVGQLRRYMESLRAVDQ
jgi:AcrR family transcriptional regulator